MNADDLAARLLSAALQEPDPAARYAAVTAEQERYQAAVTAMTATRAAILTEMNAAMSYGQIAAAIQLSRGRVQQLVESTRTADLRIRVPYDHEMRGVIVDGTAWWLLRYRADDTRAARTLPQTLARIRGDLADLDGVPAGEAQRLAADAAMRADEIQATVPGWDQRALGA